MLRQIRASSLSSTERLVLVFYVLRCDSSTGRTFVGANTIALDSSTSPKTVKRTRARLRTLGILQVTATRGGGRATDHHLLHADRIPHRQEEEGDTVSPSWAGKGTDDPPSVDEEGDRLSLDARSVGTDDPHEGDRESPQRGQRVPLSAQDLPRGSAQDKPLTPSGQVLAFPGMAPGEAPPERAKTKAEILEEDVLFVCRAWWELWDERAPWVAGKTPGSRVRSGKAAGAPRTPELTGDDRAAIRKALRGRSKRSRDELALLARWAFYSAEFAAAVLRGEAKPGQPENEHLSPVTLYRATKIPAKLSRAGRWHDMGEPRANGDAHNGTGRRPRDYETLEDLFRTPDHDVIDVTPQD